MAACPFCGDEMRVGCVRLRGLLLSGGWGDGVSVNFEVDGPPRKRWALRGDGIRRRWAVLRPGFWGRAKRSARFCTRCGALVIDPLPQADVWRPADPMDP